MTTFEYDDIICGFNGCEKLGEGGQKIVFSIEHREHGKCVLKVGRYESQYSLERIRREVEALRDISSMYYPQQLGFQVVDDHRFYVLEERIDGNPLTTEMDRFASVEKATQLVLRLVEGLKVIWERKIIHRDIKPGNIIVTPDGSPRIIDLGIARLTNLSSLTPSVWPSGPGTPIYASPEQLENRKHEINHRSDQFALGIIYAQLVLGGDHPFHPELVGHGESIVENILNNRWAIDCFQSGDRTIILPVLSRMLAREPYGRYRQPEILADALRGVLDEEGVA